MFKIKIILHSNIFNLKENEIYLTFNNIHD